MTLACKDDYSKLVEVVTVADLNDEDCVGNSLLQIWKLRFGQLQNLDQPLCSKSEQKLSFRTKRQLPNL